MLLAGAFSIGFHTSPCPSLHSRVGVTNCFIIQRPEGLRKTMKYQPGHMVDMYIVY
jgi:hypothetical protein